MATPGMGSVITARRRFAQAPPAFVVARRADSPTHHDRNQGRRTGQAPAHAAARGGALGTSAPLPSAFGFRSGSHRWASPYRRGTPAPSAADAVLVIASSHLDRSSQKRRTSFDSGGPDGPVPLGLLALIGLAAGHWRSDRGVPPLVLDCEGYSSGSFVWMAHQPSVSPDRRSELGIALSRCS
jgi:hypothetical protein